MPSKSSIGVLVSGGLDSDVLLAEMASTYKNVWPIYIRQGLAWETAELYWLKRFLNAIEKCSVPNLKRTRALCQTPISKLRVFSVPMDDVYGRHWSTGQKAVPGSRSPDQAVYLPGRNMILSVKPAVFCAMNNIHTLAIGSLDHNPFPDASPAFFKRWSGVLGKGLKFSLKVIAPYRSCAKAEVICRGREPPLHLSFSCIAPKGKYHCGRCNKCAERRRAFKAARVPDRTIYA